MAPKNATTRPGGKRFYSWRGEQYWSVTTLIKGGLPMSYGLQNWMKKSVAEGAVELVDSLPALIAADRDVAIKTLMFFPDTKRERAADLGKLVHAAAEAYALRKPYPPWDDTVRPYMDAFISFLDDFKPSFTATEASVYNRSQRYAGTLDTIAGLHLPLHEEPGTYILDTKSGKGIYPEIGLQLAAYRFAEFIGLPDGSEVPMPAVDGALGLHLTPEGYRLIEVRADEQVFAAFLYAREVFRFQEETSKTILGLEYGPSAREEVAV